MNATSNWMKWIIFWKTLLCYECYKEVIRHLGSNMPLRKEVNFSAKNLNIMVFCSGSCLGLGLIYPIASNSAGLMVLAQMSGK